MMNNGATSLEDAQKKFVELLDSVKAGSVAEFLSWIQDSFTTKEPTGEMDNADAYATIHAIAAELRSKARPSSFLSLKPSGILYAVALQFPNRSSN